MLGESPSHCHACLMSNWLLGLLSFTRWLWHNLLTISLTHERSIGNSSMAQFLYCPHISKWHSHPQVHHSTKQTNVISLLGQTNRTHYMDYPWVVLPKIRTGLTYWNLFGKSKAYQPAGRPHRRHCTFLSWDRNHLGQSTNKQHFLPRGTMAAFGILFPVREPGRILLPSREQGDLYLPWPRSSSLIGLVIVIVLL